MTLRNKMAVGAAGIGAAVLLGAGAAPAMAYPPETPTPSPSQETKVSSQAIPNTGGNGLLPVALGIGALGLGGGLVAMSRSRRTDG